MRLNYITIIDFLTLGRFLQSYTFALSLKHFSKVYMKPITYIDVGIVLSYIFIHRYIIIIILQ